MMNRNNERTLALLNLAAISVDMMLVLFITRGLWSLLDTGFFGAVFEQLPPWGEPALFIAILAAHYIFVELFTAGYSIGRLATGLHLIDGRTKQLAPLSSRANHLVNAMATGGLRSISTLRLAPYNKAPNCKLASDWAGSVENNMVELPPNTADRSQGMPPLGLSIQAGPHAGKTYALDALLGRRRDGVFIIGRDPKRALIVLAKDNGVSRIHCRMARKGTALLILDGAGQDKGSTSGTMVNGKAVSHVKPVRLQIGDKIKIGATIIGVD